MNQNQKRQNQNHSNKTQKTTHRIQLNTAYYIRMDFTFHRQTKQAGIIIDRIILKTMYKNGSGSQVTSTTSTQIKSKHKETYNFSPRLTNFRLFMPLLLTRKYLQNGFKSRDLLGDLITTKFCHAEFPY